MIKSLLRWLFPPEATRIPHAPSMPYRRQEATIGSDDTQEFDTSEYLMREYETLEEWRERLGLDHD